VKIVVLLLNFKYFILISHHILFDSILNINQIILFWHILFILIILKQFILWL
jgi:hypothetical protein